MKYYIIAMYNKSDNSPRGLCAINSNDSFITSSKDFAKEIADYMELHFGKHVSYLVKEVII